MKRLIDAFEGLFTAATLSGRELAKTANLTLENVNWKDSLRKPGPTSHPIVETYLQAACANSGPHGSTSNGVAEEARHAMQTNEQPLLTIWLWTSHLDSEVVIVRG